MSTLHKKVIQLLTDTVLHKIAKEKGINGFQGDFMFVIKNCENPLHAESGEYEYKYCLNRLYNWEYSDGCLVVFVGRPKANNKITFEGTYWELKNFAMQYNRTQISELFQNSKDLNMEKDEKDEIEREFAKNQEFLRQLRGENEPEYTSDDDVNQDDAKEIAEKMQNLLADIQSYDE